MDDKRLVANVDDPADSAACAERCHSSRIVLDRTVIVTVFDFLFFVGGNKKMSREQQQQQKCVHVRHIKCVGLISS